MIFEAKESRETAERSSMSVEGTEGGVEVKVFKVEVDFFSGNLFKKWILGYEFRLGREPREKAVKVGCVILNCYSREGFVLGFTRIKEEVTKLV